MYPKYLEQCLAVFIEWMTTEYTVCLILGASCLEFFTSYLFVQNMVQLYLGL